MISTDILLTGASRGVGSIILKLLEPDYPDLLCISRQTAVNERWLQADLNDELPACACKWLVSTGPLDALAARLEDDSLAVSGGVIALSSSSILAKSGSREVEEKMLVKSLLRAEEKLKDYCSAHQIPLLILRPTMIYGWAGNKNLAVISGLIQRFGWVPLPIRCNGLRAPVHAQDIATLVVAQLAQEIKVSGVFVLAGGESIRYREMVRRVFENLGRKARIVYLPSWLITTLARVYAWIRPGSSANGAIVERMAADLNYNDDAARDQLGWSPRGFDLGKEAAGDD